MRGGFLAGLFGALLAGGSTIAIAADEDGTKEVPPAFAPFEHLVGSWKGQGFAAKARLKGWGEEHNWAWKFVKGQAVGMTVEMTGNKALAKGQLSFDETKKTYRLEGTDPEGKKVVYVGPLDEASHILELERQDPPKGLAKEELKFFINENMIRYVLRLFQQETDAPQTSLLYEAGMGKKGESFAAGGAAADLPKCIVTGGAAAMTVSYQGKTIPICCTGCRDEFNENPEKYMKKMLLRVQKGDAAPAKTTASAAMPKEGAGEDPEPKAAPRSKTASKSRDASSKDASAGSSPTTKPADPNVRAASLLSQAQAFEKAGNASAAKSYYQRIVKDFPGTPAAKTAASKLK